MNELPLIILNCEPNPEPVRTRGKVESDLDDYEYTLGIWREA
jgi:hypothetical protein